MKKKIVPSLFLLKGQAISWFDEKDRVLNLSPVEIARWVSDNGADELLVFDLSNTPREHEENIGSLKEITRNSEIPVMVAGHINRVEDVKKFLYAGASKVFLNASRRDNLDLIEEVSKRFGKEQIGVSVKDPLDLHGFEETVEKYASSLIRLGNKELSISLPKLVILEENSFEEAVKELQKEDVYGVSGKVLGDPPCDYMKIKEELIKAGIMVKVNQSLLSWSDFKLNSDGLLPVVVQDYKTEEVLMVAYMNEESFLKTIATGKMTYYSRSRKELWLKGEISGHLQYVKTLMADCDKDTLLAKVSQVGAACHTGSRSCFFEPVFDNKQKAVNPHKVLENVYQVIMNRREFPKEGSYTNYLFDQGIDKILKKVGEEATEIIIAAKNPDPEEIKYEISDFLYHTMVLMAEKGVTWEDIMNELADR